MQHAGWRKPLYPVEVDLTLSTCLHLLKYVKQGQWQTQSERGFMINVEHW